ncbi:MAG TPA: tetratricopeptide repeat protein [Chitinophagales bacterium]|nr:tetratricopeptide repeat protein [Chitinophagales bacterium]
MNAEQLLKQVMINRGLIVRKSEDAHEHLQTLEQEYAHLINEEIALAIALNHSLVHLTFKGSYKGAIDNSLTVLDKYLNTTHKNALSFHLKMVGVCYAHLGDFDLSERYLLNAIDTVDEDANPCKVTKSDIFHSLAMAQDFKDPYSIKIPHYLNLAVELLGENTEDDRMANCIMGLGNYYNNIDRVDEALVQFKKAAAVFEKNYRLNNMAGCYSNMGSCYLKLKNIPEAESYLEKALELRLKSGSPNDLAISYFNMGVLCFEKANYVQAEEYLNKVLLITERTGNKPFTARVNDKLDELARVKNNLRAA